MQKKPKSSESDLDIGKNIRFFRKQKNMSSKQLAELVGITYQQINKYEKGHNRISASRLYLVAKILGRDIKDFFSKPNN